MQIITDHKHNFLNQIHTMILKNRRRRNDYLLAFLNCKSQFTRIHHLNTRNHDDMSRDYLGLAQDVMITVYKEKNRITNFEVLDFDARERAIVYPDLNGQLDMIKTNFDKNYELDDHAMQMRESPCYHGDIKQAEKQFLRLRSQNPMLKAA